MRRSLIIIATAFAIALSLAGCGGGGGGGGSSSGGPVTPPPPPPATLITNQDIQGTWDVSINGVFYCRVVLDNATNMLSCTDATYHAGGYLVQSNVPYSATIPYTAKMLIDADWTQPTPELHFTSTIYAGYLTQDKQTWTGTYTSTRMQNGVPAETQTGNFTAVKVPTGAG